MKHCCEEKAEALEQLRFNQGRVLKAVLAVNATMFVVEVTAGIIGHSTALLADSLDMFGDAALYGVSLYVLERGKAWQARASILKAAVMAMFGLGVLLEVVLKVSSPVVPHAATMGSIGLLALAANGVCLLLLLRHRSDDINMQSAWICSRNDIIANIAVIGAAVAVRLTGTIWPDIIVGVSIATLFLVSAVGVLHRGISSLRRSARTRS